MKLKELIEQPNPVVMGFFSNANLEGEKELYDLQKKFDNEIKVVTLSVEQNEKISIALRVKQTPCVIIYQDGLMKYREVGIKINRISKLLETYNNLK